MWFEKYDKITPEKQLGFKRSTGALGRLAVGLGEAGLVWAGFPFVSHRGWHGGAVVSSVASLLWDWRSNFYLGSTCVEVACSP